MFDAEGKRKKTALMRHLIVAVNVFLMVYILLLTANFVESKYEFKCIEHSVKLVNNQ